METQNKILHNKWNVKQKEEKLKVYLKEADRIAIAFSGGVDSTYLLKTAHEVLGERAVAVTAISSTFPKREIEEARLFCEKENIRQIVVYCDEMQIEGFKENPKNRCYICKKALFLQMLDAVKKEGIETLAEGSNMDDLRDYRPGMKAVAELGIVSPLRMAELYKSEIRECSKALDLPTWEKPSFACLASRFVYGETITKEKLWMVEMAEELLREMGFRQFRVRIHGRMARIEVLPEEFEKLMKKEKREQIVKSFAEYGFSYVTLDLTGYRTGSMNEIL